MGEELKSHLILSPMSNPAKHGEVMYDKKPHTLQLNSEQFILSISGDDE